MKQIIALSIGSTIALASTTSLSHAETPDQWGQTPADGARSKVEEAVRLGGTDLLAAEKLLTEARDAEPDYYRAQLNVGLVKLSMNNNKEAAEELKKALALQTKLQLSDPTIYADLGLANHRADKPTAATLAFTEGVKMLDKLPPTEQKKLLLRGISFYLDYQQIQSARKLVSDASKSLDRNTFSEVRKFLTESIARLTQNDPAEGWIKYGNESSGTDGQWLDVLVKKDNSPPGTPKANEVVTPDDRVINMREGPMWVENKQQKLARQTGFARIGEKFTILEAQSVPLPDGTGNAWWIKVRRTNSP